MTKQIAILGFGVVGGGCADVLYDNMKTISDKLGFEIHVKYILDLREFPDSRFGNKIVHDINIILDDPEVELVAEMMGGSHPALEFSLAAMNKGKHVVTSNKEVVSTHGLELLECAHKNGVKYMFEASVGGGIPVIHTIDSSLAQNNITKINGILNGTTNYILTRMNTAGVSFGEALAEAQAKGYAEADPSADVDGIDVCRKICILSALAFGKLPDPDGVHTEGIRYISASDAADAAKMGATVKLIGNSYAKDNKICVYVCPMIVRANDPLYTVNDVFNGVKIDGDMVGEVMLYGRGAGKLPTASAVVADILNILSGVGVDYSWQEATAADLITFDNAEFKNYIRVDNAANISAVIRNTLKPISESSFITPVMSEAEYKAFEANLGTNIKSRIRVLK